MYLMGEKIGMRNNLFKSFDNYEKGLKLNSYTFCEREYTVDYKNGMSFVLGYS